MALNIKQPDNNDDKKGILRIGTSGIVVPVKELFPEDFKRKSRLNYQVQYLIRLK